MSPDGATATIGLFRTTWRPGHRHHSTASAWSSKASGPHIARSVYDTDQRAEKSSGMPPRWRSMAAGERCMIPEKMIVRPSKLSRILASRNSTADVSRRCTFVKSIITKCVSFVSLSPTANFASSDGTVAKTRPSQSESNAVDPNNSTHKRILWEPLHWSWIHSDHWSVLEIVVRWKTLVGQHLQIFQV